MSVNKKFLNKSGAAALTDYEFNQVLYTGDGTTGKSITGIGFKPDKVWVKPRSETGHHSLFDALRGASMVLTPNQTGAQIDRTSNSAGVTSFDSDGFTVSDPGGAAENYYVNQSSVTYAAWCWKASGNSTTNNDGGKQSTVSASNGFSIISYTASSGGTQTVGHGMDSAPEMIIQKRTDATEAWYVYIAPGIIDSTSNYYYLTHSTDAKGTSGGSVPTATTFNAVSTAGNYLAYAFYSLSGKSKVGQYTVSNSGTDTVVTTGFAVNWLILKRTDTSGTSWLMVDGARDTSNPITCYFSLNGDHEEFCGGGTDLDFESTGFRINSTATWSGMNATGGVYFYFAQLAS